MSHWLIDWVLEAEKMPGKMPQTVTDKENHTLTEQHEYLDYKGLCALLKVTYGTVRNWKSSGKLTYTTFNGKVLFPKKIILKNLRRNTLKSTDGMLKEISEKN